MSFFLSCVFYTPVNNHFLYQTPGRRPSHLTRRVVNAVITGWVGAPKKRTSFRKFMTPSLVWSIDACRRLGISSLQSKHLAEFFRSWRKISAQEINMAVIFEIQSFILQHRACIVVVGLISADCFCSSRIQKYVDENYGPSNGFCFCKTVFMLCFV